MKRFWLYNKKKQKQKDGKSVIDRVLITYFLWIKKMLYYLIILFFQSSDDFSETFIGQDIGFNINDLS